MRNRHHSRALPILAAGVLLLLGMAACSSDSPTEPSPSPAPPGGGGGGGTFNITVTTSASEIAAGSDDPIIITVQVRRADNGQPPATGTTAVLSASLGDLGSQGGASSVVVVLSNGVAQVPFFAGDISGNAIIQAQLSGSIGQATILIRASETFFLAFVNPNVGSPQGGDAVSISGGGFEEPVRVFFGGTIAQVLSVSSTQIRAVTPPSSQGPNAQSTVAVTVTINVNEDGQDTDSLTGGFTYRPGGGGGTPAIFSNTPTGGPNEGGTPVSILGEGFQAPVQVVFGNSVLVEAQVQSVTSGRIEVLSPAATGFGAPNQNQLVDIRVTNLNSGLSATRADAFQYGLAGQMFISGISPNTGSANGLNAAGNPILVRIFGQGFAAPLSVHIGNPNSAGAVEQSVTSVSGTEIVFRLTPITLCSNLTAPVVVTNLNTGEQATGQAFTYLAAVPLVLGVTPNSGSPAGGLVVTVTGQNFLAPLRVLFGGSAGTVLSNTSTSISVRTPAFGGTFETAPCSIPGPMPEDPETPGEMLLPTSVDVEVTNLTTSCTSTLPGAFTYVPASTCVPTGGGGG